MISFKQAIAMRKLIEESSAGLTDEQAAEAPHMFPAWSGARYTPQMSVYSTRARPTSACRPTCPRLTGRRTWPSHSGQRY